MEQPVFVDPTGRRERRVRLALVAAVCLSALWLASLAVGCVGFTNLPVTAPLRLVHVVAGHQRADRRGAARSAIVALEHDLGSDLREHRRVHARVPASLSSQRVDHERSS